MADAEALPFETAKANVIEPYRYLRYFFTKLPFTETRDDYLSLTPQGLSQKDLENLSL